MKANPKLLLCIILTFSFILRFWNLTNVPNGFHDDEASLGFNAYSILTTGMDEYGSRLPLYVNTFGDYRPALHYYLVAPVVFLFGNTVFSVRLISALLGALTPLLVYFLLRKLNNNKSNIALLSAFLISVSPWHIVSSRASSDAIVALFFLLVAAIFFLSLLINQKIKYLVMTVFFSLFSILSYHTPRIFITLLFLGFLIIFLYYKKAKTTAEAVDDAISILARSAYSQKTASEANRYKADERTTALAGGLYFKNISVKKIKIPIIALFITVSLSLLLIFSIKGGTGRASQVSIFTNREEQLLLEEQIREDGILPVLITRTFHNKLVNYTSALASNYFQYFTSDYLFFKGGFPLRYQVPDMGLLYLIEMPFLLAGIFMLVKNRGNNIIFLYWLALGPVISAMTVDDIPNVQRSIFMLPALQVIIAIGLLGMYEKIKKTHFKKIILAIFSIVFTYNFVFFLHQYFYQSLVHRPWYRNDGFISLAKILPSYKNKYEKIVITNSQGPAYNYLLYFNKVDPVYFLSKNTKPTNGQWNFENYEFNPRDCPIDERINVLFVCKGESELTPKESLKFKQIYEIKRNDNTVVFRFFERKVLN